MTIGKTIALTRQTFVGKVMSLLFNTLSRLVIAFLPKSKCLLRCNLIDTVDVAQNHSLPIPELEYPLSMLQHFGHLKKICYLFGCARS